MCEVYKVLYTSLFIKFTFRMFCYFKYAKFILYTFCRSMKCRKCPFCIKYKMSNVHVICCIRKYEVYIFCTKEDIENKKNNNRYPLSLKLQAS